MRRTRIALLLAALMVLVAAPAANAHDRDHHDSGGRWHRLSPPGVVPPWLPIHGHTLKDFATDWSQWAYGTGEDNPLLAVRCEQSPLDPRVWYLPVSLGGEWTNTCDVPRGSYLFLNPGGAECSNVEAPPWFGANERELRKCVNDGFKLLTHAEVTIRGKTTTDLRRHVATTRLMHLPANNLLSADPALSMSKGYFLLLWPMKPGTHTIRAYDEFASIDFTAGITYTINVH